MKRQNSHQTEPSVTDLLVGVEGDIQKKKYGKELSKIKDVKTLRIIADRLWMLLDDIDTASDIFKPSTEKSFRNFYKYSMEKADQRFRAMESDGYKLYLSKRYTVQSDKEYWNKLENQKQPLIKYEDNQVK